MRRLAYLEVDELIVSKDAREDMITVAGYYKEAGLNAASEEIAGLVAHIDRARRSLVEDHERLADLLTAGGRFAIGKGGEEELHEAAAALRPRPKILIRSQGGTVDIADLGAGELRDWLRSKPVEFAHDVVGIVLGHGHLSEAPRSDEPSG